MGRARKYGTGRDGGGHLCFFSFFPFCMANDHDHPPVFYNTLQICFHLSALLGSAGWSWILPVAFFVLCFTSQT